TLRLSSHHLCVLNYELFNHFIYSFIHVVQKCIFLHHHMLLKSSDSRLWYTVYSESNCSCCSLKLHNIDTEKLKYISSGPVHYDAPRVPLRLWTCVAGHSHLVSLKKQQNTDVWIVSKCRNTLYQDIMEQLVKRTEGFLHGKLG
uniref:Uncharacterized protein n=1 Tax=Mastacembelus armatus TaxID=205130 RepID=A0A7N8WWJ1_9TELE